MNTDNAHGDAINTFATPAVLHCFDSYLRTTENWAYRLIKHQIHTQRILASDRFLECSFNLPHVVMLRSPLQPYLSETAPVTGMRRGVRIATRVTYPWYLQMALRGHHVDVVHSHFGQVGWRYRNLARRLHAVHVVSFYGWDYVRMAAADASWGPRLQRLYAMADCFVCEGPHGASLLASNGCPEAKIRIAPLGVEPELIPVFHRVKHAGSLRLLQLASFREKKGHIDTINAFTMALKGRPDMQLTLVGSIPGPIRDEIATIAKARGICDKITLRPGVCFDDLHTTMRDQDVFIHPSHHARDGDCEGGAPVVLLDAQATGMPVISTTHCDIPQEVVHKKSGILCAERDVTGLAAAIRYFYDMDQATYSRYAQAARRHIEDHFDARCCAAHVEEIYRQLLADRVTE